MDIIEECNKYLKSLDEQRDKAIEIGKQYDSLIPIKKIMIKRKGEKEYVTFSWNWYNSGEHSRKTIRK